MSARPGLPPWRSAAGRTSAARLGSPAAALADEQLRLATAITARALAYLA